MCQFINMKCICTSFFFWQSQPQFWWKGGEGLIWEWVICDRISLSIFKGGEPLKMSRAAYPVTSTHLKHTHTHTCLKARWSVTSLYVSPRNWIKQMRDSEHTAIVRQHVCLPGHFRVHSYLYVCVCVLASLTSLGALVRRFSRLFVCGYVFVPKGRSMGNSSRPNLIVAVQTDL